MLLKIVSVRAQVQPQLQPKMGAAEEMAIYKDKEQVGDYLVRGIEDCMVFITDKEGCWYKLQILKDEDAWDDVEEDLRDSLGGAYIVGLNLLQSGKALERLQKITDTAELSRIGSALADS